MIDVSKQNISINCPACKRSIIISLKQVADVVSVKCSCGQGVKLTDNNGSAKKSIRDINKSFQDLENAFKNFGKLKISTYKRTRSTKSCTVMFTELIAYISKHGFVTIWPGYCSPQVIT